MLSCHCERTCPKPINLENNELPPQKRAIKRGSVPVAHKFKRNTRGRNDDHDQVVLKFSVITRFSWGIFQSPPKVEAKIKIINWERPDRHHECRVGWQVSGGTACNTEGATKRRRTAEKRGEGRRVTNGSRSKRAKGPIRGKRRGRPERGFRKKRNFSCETFPIGTNL